MIYNPRPVGRDCRSSVKNYSSYLSSFPFTTAGTPCFIHFGSGASVLRIFYLARAAIELNGCQIWQEIA